MRARILAIIAFSTFLNSFAWGQLPLQPFRLRIVRERVNGASLNSSSCIAGKLYQVSDFSDPTANPKGMILLSDTLELPWKQNANYFSSIKTGQYKAIATDAPPAVPGEPNLGWRILLQGTEPRYGILIHVGTRNLTSIRNTLGCILVGSQAASGLGPCELADSPKFRDKIRSAYGDQSNKRPVELQIVESQ
jgi:hypothetical protein